MLTDVTKALFYSCSSYPKIAAPHRFSPSDDFETCILSSITSALGVYNNVLRIILEFKRGERDIRKLEVGKNIGKSLLLCLQELKHNMLVEICIVAPMLIYIDVIQTEIERDFHKAFRRFFNVLQVLDIEDSREFIKFARNVGGYLYSLIERSNISEHRILIEELRLYNVFEELSRHDPSFEWISNTQKIWDAIKLAEKLYNEFKDLNIALSKLFLELAKNKIDVTSDKLIDILKIDVNYRRKGLNLSYLLPYLGYAALYLVKLV
ncbi:MAG: hypothetical protein QXL96_00450 [Ignisphaera sp.]